MMEMEMEIEMEQNSMNRAGSPRRVSPVALGVGAVLAIFLLVTAVIVLVEFSDRADLQACRSTGGIVTRMDDGSWRCSSSAGRRP